MNDFMRRLRSPSSVVSLILAVLLFSGFGYYQMQSKMISFDGISLEFIPAGDIDLETVERIASETAQSYGMTYKIFERMNLPQDAYIDEKGQYDISLILAGLRKSPSAPNTKRIMITDADVTTTGYNFLFGLADLGGTASVMSTHRLMPKLAKSGDRNVVFFDHCVKIAIHELGHTFGFTHCENNTCVMCFSNSSLELDFTDREFCAECMTRIRHSRD
ncbi:MAG: hypothetical protein ACYC0V_08090 [Armatimonadota bacterium]